MSHDSGSKTPLCEICRYWRCDSQDCYLRRNPGGCIDGPKPPFRFTFYCEDVETVREMRLEVQKRFPKANHITIRERGRSE